MPQPCVLQTFNWAAVCLQAPPTRGFDCNGSRGHGDQRCGRTSCDLVDNVLAASYHSLVRRPYNPTHFFFLVTLPNDEEHELESQCRLHREPNLAGEEGGKHLLLSCRHWLPDWAWLSAITTWA